MHIECIFVSKKKINMEKLVMEVKNLRIYSVKDDLQWEEWISSQHFSHERTLEGHMAHEKLLISP